MNKSDYLRARAIVHQLHVMSNGTAPVKGDKTSLQAELQELYKKFQEDKDVHNLHEFLCLENYYFRGFNHSEIMQYIYGNSFANNYSANRIYHVFNRKKNPLSKAVTYKPRLVHKK